jgi:uncharacterized membrane protein
MSEHKEKIRKLIIDTLKRSPVIQGTTVSDIVSRTGLPRSTAHIYLSILEAQGLIDHIRIGKTNVYRLKPKK